MLFNFSVYLIIWNVICKCYICKCYNVANIPIKINYLKVYDSSVNLVFVYLCYQINIYFIGVVVIWFESVELEAGTLRLKGVASR